MENNYNIIKTDKSILNFKEILEDKIYDVRKELLDAAIKNYISANGMSYDDFISQNTIVPIYTDIYYEPIKIKTINKDKGINIIDLKEYWPIYNYKKFKDDETINASIDGKYSDDELVYIDYIRNYGLLYNRYNNIYRKISLDSINPDIKISEDFSLKNTFYNLYYENI